MENSMPDSTRSDVTVGGREPKQVGTALICESARIVIDGRRGQDIGGAVEGTRRGLVPQMIDKLVSKIRQLTE